MAYKFSDCCTVIENENKIVLANRQGGSWVRISKEVYDILIFGIQNNYTLNELKSFLFDDEDKDYIDTLYKKLYSVGIIEDDSSNYNSNKKMVLFEITHRCNLRCIHCCVDADYKANSNTDLSTLEIISALDKIIAWKPEKIALTGGEPMIRKDFFTILKYLRENYNGKVQILTNGTLIEDNNADKICKYVDQIDMSLDGIDEETCSIVRGKGVFSKVLKNVRILQNMGFYSIALSIALGDKNSDLEENFVELNETLGTTPIIRTFAPVGRGELNRKFFSNKGLTEAPLPDKYLEGKFTKTLGACNCSAGTCVIYVKHNGDIYPCQTFRDREYRLDNIFEIGSLDDLKKLKYKKVFEEIIKYYPDNYDKCKKCNVNLFCWPCPGELYLYSKNKEIFEDICRKTKAMLTEKVWGT